MLIYYHKQLQLFLTRPNETILVVLTAIAPGIFFAASKMFIYFHITFSRLSSHIRHNFTVTICPGPFGHSMAKMSWRNDNGDDGVSD
jgi:hypothetical protein